MMEKYETAAKYTLEAIGCAKIHRLHKLSAWAHVYVAYIQVGRVVTFGH